MSGRFSPMIHRRPASLKPSRRGYRFIAAVTPVSPRAHPANAESTRPRMQLPEQSSAAERAWTLEPPPGAFVGRAKELVSLRDLLAETLSVENNAVFPSLRSAEARSIRRSARAHGRPWTVKATGTAVCGTARTVVWEGGWRKLVARPDRNLSYRARAQNSVPRHPSCGSSCR
jgi:hypothetical protein